MLSVALLILDSCHGFQDPNDFLTAEPQGPFELSVDKSTIESDGADAAVLTITDVNGLILTEGDYLRNTSFYIEELDEWRSGIGGSTQPNVFTSIADGTYTISAMYQGAMCENSVTVTSQNRSKYEVFHKNVAIYRLTGTWCQYCPFMTEALANVDDYTKNHSVVFEFHANDEFSVPYNSTMDMASMLLSRFGTSDDGYPYCIYSLKEGSGKRTVNDIQRLVKNQLNSDPARTGIKATSTLENGKLTVNATVKASAGGKYDLGIAVLKDKCRPTSSSAYEEVYNDVVLMISGNFFAMSTDSFDLESGAEFDVEKVCEHPDLVSGSNCKVALFTLTESGGKVIIDNVATFKVGESVDYRYNTSGDSNQGTEPGDKPSSGYVQKMIGMQFTSVGCVNCPFLSTAIKDVQANYPGKMIPVSFHLDYGDIEDPMTLPVNSRYYEKVKTGDGLPMFALNFRKSSKHIINEYAKIVSEMEYQAEAWPAVCGVAIESRLTDGTIEVTARFKSDVAEEYRYQMFLVEDGIRYMQTGSDKADYVHDNVLRTVVGDNVLGNKLNQGSRLTAGKEYTVTKTIAVEDGWNPENMRVVVAMLNTENGGETFCSNNANECKVGESVGWNGNSGSDGSSSDVTLIADKPDMLADGNDAVTFTVRVGNDDVTSSSLIICTSTPEGEVNPQTVDKVFKTKDPGTYTFVAWYDGRTSAPVTVTASVEDGPVDSRQFQRRVCIMEFTGAWCAQCPDGATTLNYLVSRAYKDKAYALAFHNNDIYAIPQEQELYKIFGWGGYPAYVTDMRDVGLLNEGTCEASVEKSLYESETHCGAAVSSTYDQATAEVTVDARVFSRKTMNYRIAAYVIEDKIKGEQTQSTGTVNKNYTHRHVVRQMLSSNVRGDSMGSIKNGTEVQKTFTFKVDEGWNLDNLSVAVLAIDANGHVNNMAICSVNGGMMDYEYVNN